MTSKEIAKEFARKNQHLETWHFELELAKLITSVYITGVHHTVDRPFWKAVPTEVNISRDELTGII